MPALCKPGQSAQTLQKEKINGALCSLRLARLVDEHDSKVALQVRISYQTHLLQRGRGTTVACVREWNSNERMSALLPSRGDKNTMDRFEMDRERTDAKNCSSSPL